MSWDPGYRHGTWLTSLTRPCTTVRSTTELLLQLPPFLRFPSTLAIPSPPDVAVICADADADADEEEEEEEVDSVVSALASKAK